MPAHAKFTCDVRIPVGLRSVDVRKGIRTILESFPKTGGMAIEYRFGQPVEPYESPVSSVLVRAFCRGILLSTGQKPVLLRKTGTGDMNIFANGIRCESITYGPGQAALSHTNLESVKIDDYLQSIEVLDGALRQLKRISNSNSS